MNRIETENFRGDWLVQFSSTSADFSQRFVIIGSTSSDGIYPGTAGTQISRVSGQKWSIKMEWNNNVGSGWQPSDIRTYPTYLIQEGLIITLYADDNYENMRDFDYNDLVPRCRSLDPALNPIPPNGNNFGFFGPRVPKEAPGGRGSGQKGSGEGQKGSAQKSQKTEDDGTM